MDFAEKVGIANPKEATLQFKLLKFYMRIAKGDLALTTIQTMVRQTPDHAKTHRGVELFETWLASDAGKAKSAINKVASDLFTGVVLKDWKSKHTLDTAASKIDLELAYESLKSNNKGNGLKDVMSAIDKDPLRSARVHIAEKIHLRLANASKTQNGDKTAKDFMSKGKVLYKYSVYFDGSSKNEK